MKNMLTIPVALNVQFNKIQSNLFIQNNTLFYNITLKKSL